LPHREEIDCYLPSWLPGWTLNPRNRRIAEVLSKCGLVERAGQGFDLIFRECIRQSKPLPDFSRTDTHFVWLTLHGEIQDTEFLRFLEEVSQERMAEFSTEDFLVVDLIHREQKVPRYMKSRVDYLIGQGVIERMGRGRGTRYILSRSFYAHMKTKGVYTRRKGLDYNTNKALLLQHLTENKDTGCPIVELEQVIPSLSRRAIQRLLGELRSEGKARLAGSKKAARWWIA